MGNIDYTPFIDGMVNLGNAGIDGAVTLGTSGFDANTSIATTGLDSAVTLGTVGMDNLTSFGTSAVNGMITLDAGNNALYSSVWTTYTESLQGILGTLPDPVTCSVDADGAVACQ
jgi:hypothetical protein